MTFPVPINHGGHSALPDITFTDDGPVSNASGGTTTITLGSLSSTGPRTYALISITGTSDLTGNINVTFGGNAGTIIKQDASNDFVAYSWRGIVYWNGAQSGNLVVTGPTGDLTRAAATVISLDNVSKPTTLRDEQTGTTLNSLEASTGGIRLVVGTLVDSSDFAMSMINATQLDEFAVGAGVVLNAHTGYDLGEGSDTITLTNASRGIGIALR